MQLIIVSGRSGSGKSTALHVLEDAGYYCIDNLPAGLLSSLIEQMENAGGAAFNKVAVSIDARNVVDDFSRFPDIIKNLPERLKTEVLYLDATDASLITRFSETRRKHPLTKGNLPLNDAIAEERKLLEPIAIIADLTIDTSEMNLHQLRDLLTRRLVRSDKHGMAVLFQSFGFKRGVPIDADIVYDVRCLPNPHWVASLRPKTGMDEEVIDFLEGQEEVQTMLDDICRFLEKWLPHYESSNRSYITIAVGCTGGQHRSVYLCEQMARKFGDSYPNIQVRHRELSTQQVNS
jgi:UPF0042 nucleotide-binding protein